MIIIDVLDYLCKCEVVVIDVIMVLPLELLLLQ